MNFQEYSERILDSDVIPPDPNLQVTAGPDGVCVVDGFYPLPLLATSSLLPRGEVIAVNEADGTPIGELITCSGETFAISQFSATYLAAYLAEASPSSYGQDGRFACDYFVLRIEQLDTYRSEYLSTSPIWGGFQHLTGNPRSQPLVSRAPILAAKGINLPSVIYAETAERSVRQPYAFERFLKLYHLLELGFDHDVVRKIQALGDDLKGIGKILSSYDSNELNRLKQIVATCRDPEAVIECIRWLTSDPRWHGLIQEIFFDFGKAGNPVSANKQVEFMQMLGSSGYSLLSIQPLSGTIPAGRQSPAQQTAFEVFSLDLAAYWIYRVRSSIAHSRIGEYVMRTDDEAFVAFFAEPLLRCVLVNVL